MKYPALDTVEKIATHAADTLDYNDAQYIMEGNTPFVGQFIRNEYGLWEDNPLTAGWSNNPDSRKIVDDVDFSPDHPDNVSETIRIRLIEILRERENIK